MSPRGIDVELAGPLDIPASLAGIGRWGDDLLDRWDGRRLLRTVTVGGRSMAFAAMSVGTVDEPVLRVLTGRRSEEASAVEAAGALFVPAPPSYARLRRSDPVIGALDRRFPGVRPVLQADLFLALVRAVSAQQITLSFAARLRGRLAERFGESHRVADEEVRRLDPDRLADVPIAELRALQFSTAKAQAIVGVAAAVASSHISLDRLRVLPDEEVVNLLTELRGIGRWSAEWILVRTLGRPRVVAGDLGVRKAVGRAYLETALPSEAEVRLATAHWGDAAAIAQQLLLHALIEGALEQPPAAMPR